MLMIGTKEGSIQSAKHRRRIESVLPYVLNGKKQEMACACCDFNLWFTLSNPMGLRQEEEGTIFDQNSTMFANCLVLGRGRP